MRKLIRLFLTVVLIVPSPLSAADGDLDPTFGAGGIVITDFLGGRDYAFTLALQSDGKIVAAGHTTTGFALARYNSDGSLDTGDSQHAVSVAFLVVACWVVQAKMAQAERLLRSALIQILQGSELTKTFSGKGRERFLNDLVFKNGAA